MAIWDFFTGKKSGNQEQVTDTTNNQTGTRTSNTRGTQNLVDTQNQTQRTVGTQDTNTTQNTALNSSTFAQQVGQTQQSSTGSQRTNTTQNRAGTQSTQALSDQTIAELQGITALLGDLTAQGAGSQGIAGDVVNTILQNASTAKGDVLASVAAALDQAKLNYARGTGTEVLNRANQIGSRGNTAFMEVNNRGEAELATQLATVSTQGAVMAREQELRELSAGLQGAQTNASLNLQTANVAAAVAGAEKGGRTTTNYSETLQSVADTISSMLTNTTQSSQTAQEVSQLTGSTTLGTTRSDVTANTGTARNATTNTEQQVADLIESLTSGTASGSTSTSQGSSILDWLNVFK